MYTYHGIRQCNNIVHNVEPVDLHEPRAFTFQYTLLLDAYDFLWRLLVVARLRVRGINDDRGAL